MSNTITLFDKEGSLLWDLSISGFTGLFVLDDTKNIYALIDNGDSSGEVQKYDSDGNFLDNATFSYTPLSIAYGYDKNIYVGGDGYFTKFTESLELVATNNTYGGAITQIYADADGNIRTADSVWMSIDAYDNTVSWQWFFSASDVGSVPRFALTEECQVYAYLAYQLDEREWEERTTDEFWVSASPESFFDAVWEPERERWELTNQTCMRLEVVGNWATGREPTKIAIEFGGADFAEIDYFKVGDEDGYADNIYNPSMPERVAGAVEFDIDLEFWGTPYDLFYIELWCFSDADIPIDVYITGIHIFTDIKVGVIALDFDGNVTGFLPRTDNVQQLLFDQKNNLVVRENDSVLTKIDLSTTEETWTVDTENDISTIVTTINNELPDTSSNVGKISFSSEITVVGQEAECVRPLGNILFFQPTPTIDGFLNTIYPQPGGIDFSGDVKIPAVINAAKGSLVVKSSLSPGGSPGIVIVIPVVSTPGSIQFAGASPTIEGHQTIIKQIDGEIQVSGGLTSLDISGGLTKVTSTVGSCEFTGHVDANIDGFMTILKPKGAIQFSGASPSIEGAQTIIKSTGNLSFFSLPFAFLLGVNKKNGLAVLNDPPIMQFSSTRIGINQQTIYASSAAINFKSSAWVIGMDDRVGEVSIELSALDLSISQASFIDTELPSLEVSITGWPGRGASIDSSFPELNAELFAAGGIGSRSPLELPLFDFELSGYPNRVASIEDTFPGLNVELFVGGVAEFEFPLFIQEISSTATVLATITAIIPSLIPGGVISLASAGDITGVFPGFTMSSVGLGGIVADETMRLPRFNFSGTIISGQVADIEMISPQFLSDISAVRSGPGQIDFTIPMISLQALSINPDDGILRFHKERIR